VIYVVWEFRVKKGKQRKFVQHYSSNGEWAKLFRRRAGYVETILWRDRAERERYLLTDIWRSFDSYQEFKKRFRSEYEEMDRKCEAFTVDERCIGIFQKS